MDDAQETRRLATNWREYLAESRESFSVYAWAWREFITTKSRSWMKKGVTALLLLTALAMVEPWLIKLVIDGLLAHQGRTVICAVGALIAILVMQRFCQWAHDHYRELSLGEDMGQLDIRASELFLSKSLNQHMQDTGLLDAASVEKGRNRVLDVEHMLVYEGIPVLIELGLAFGCLWLISPVVGSVMTCLLAVYLVFMLFINRRVLVECTPIDAELRKFNRHRVERWDNVERVKTNGKEVEEIRFMTRWFADILVKDRQFWLWVIRVKTYRGMINVFATGIVMAYCAWLVWRGHWTVGYLFPFFQWSGAITRNLWRIGEIEHRLNWSMPSVRSLRSALTMKSDVTQDPDAPALPRDRSVRVELKNIGHAYTGHSKNGAKHSLHVLKRVSLTVEPGEKVALIGTSGAGKTTVMRLLQRYMDPEQGAVFINDRDLRDLDLDSWRRLVGYVPQQAQVLDGTIRYNLLYGLLEEERERVTDDEIWRIMRELQIDFGHRLSHGLDTMVGRRGIKLSGGQAQRLMIGAAVLKRPRFVVIDEATSSLDSTTEKAVQDGLATALAPETSALIITHRLTTVRRICSQFVVLKPADALKNGEGQVEAVASSFEELYLISPTFRRLADDQGVVMH